MVLLNFFGLGGTRERGKELERRDKMGMIQKVDLFNRTEKYIIDHPGTQDTSHNGSSSHLCFATLYYAERGG